MTSPPVLLFDGVTRLFGGHPALVRASLTIGRGTLVALVGPNGAGKTTLLRIAATLLRPTFGRASVDGLDLTRDRTKVRSLIGYLGHRQQLYEDLTCEENLRFWATMFDVGDREIPSTLDSVGLLRDAQSRVRALSQGQRQRLALARLLLRRPLLSLLDEPFASLDEEGKTLVHSILEEARSEGRAVVFATHELERGIAMADRVVTLHGGRVLADLPASEAAATLETHHHE